MYMVISSLSPALSRKLIFVNNLLTTKWIWARPKRAALTAALLELAGFGSLPEFLDAVRPQTAVISLVGGAASRWDKSFDDPIGKEIAEKFGIVRGKSRFLAHVTNILPGNTSADIPILTYNLYGIRRILMNDDKNSFAKHILIYSKDEEIDEIRQITTGFGMPNTILCKQEIHPGKTKPAGHADAVLQHLDKIGDASYILTHFGGDVTSAKTVELSLLCLFVAQKIGMSVDVILPTANMDTPKYPVFIDAAGLPRQFGHEKLLGKDSLHTDQPVLSQGGSNIGVRAYSAEGLRATFATLSPEFADKEEFALDHVDQYFAELGTIRQLAIALPEEISHAAKMLTEVPAFLENEKIVLRDNGLLNSSS